MVFCSRDLIRLFCNMDATEFEPEAFEPEVIGEFENDEFEPEAIREDDQVDGNLDQHVNIGLEFRRPNVEDRYDEDENFHRPRKVYRCNYDQLFAVKSSGHGGCIIRVNNTDDLCLARALVTARCRLHKDDSPEG